MSTIDTEKTKQEDSKLLAALALAMVENPRASLQELSKAVGVSKATLYRFCRTREQLVQRLLIHGIQAFNQSIETAKLDTLPPLEALKLLIIKGLEHRELLAFLTHYWNDASIEQKTDKDLETALDAFFLRGQQTGVFRIDIPASALTELWMSMVAGLVDAERRGRIARTGMAALVERAFLNGIAS